ncbi:hypothetical protein HDU98_008584 [Podochytrium sp. JEL0797]|nr:hypothetical protein HDU98_008584 [Podochytrium sp. JEL0797]
MYERRQTVLVQRREDPEFRPTGIDAFLTADVTRATKQRSETAGLFSVMAEGLEYANTPFQGLFDRFGVAVNVEKTARFVAIEPQLWTTEDLVEWLESLGYGIEVVNEFRQQQYDGNSLQIMSASPDFCLDVLTTGFHFPQTESRFKLAQHISTLFSEQQAGTTGGVSNSPPIYSQIGSFASVDAALWTTNQLVEWLESLQYGFAVTNAFKHQSCNGETLKRIGANPDICFHALTIEFQIPRTVSRFRLAQHVCRLFAPIEVAEDAVDALPAYVDGFIISC